MRVVSAFKQRGSGFLVAIAFSASVWASGPADYETRWEELSGQAEEGWPEPEEVAKVFSIEEEAFREFLANRLDRGLGIDDGIAAARVLDVQPVNGMLFVDLEFGARSPAGKVLLMKAMQHLPYLECCELMLEATSDRETVRWNIPPGTKGSEPSPPGSTPMRVCDEAFRYLRWRLREWSPLKEALGRRSLTTYTGIEERDDLIEDLKKVWEQQGGELLFPSYRMAQTGSAEQGLGPAAIAGLRESVLEAEIELETRDDISGVPREYLKIPEPLTIAYGKDPIAVLLELRLILAKETPANARKAYAFGVGLFFSGEQGSKAASIPSEAYDQPAEDGGRLRRLQFIRRLEGLLFAVAGQRLPPGYELEYLGYYAPGAEFKRFDLEDLPEDLQSYIYGFSTNLFREEAMPFAYNPDLYKLIPAPREIDARIRVSASQTKGQKDLIELSWSVFETEIKWVIGQNISCLIIPRANFDSTDRFVSFLEKVYLMEDEPNWYQPYKVELPWPENLRDGIEISSDISRHPSLDVFVWPLRVDAIVRDGAVHILTYHRNMQIPGFEAGDAWFTDRFVREVAKKKPLVALRLEAEDTVERIRPVTMKLTVTNHSRRVLDPALSLRSSILTLDGQDYHFQKGFRDQLQNLKLIPPGKKSVLTLQSTWYGIGGSLEKSHHEELGIQWHNVITNGEHRVAIRADGQKSNLTRFKAFADHE